MRWWRPRQEGASVRRKWGLEEDEASERGVPTAEARALASKQAKEQVGTGAGRPPALWDTGPTALVEGNENVG